MTGQASDAEGRSQADRPSPRRILSPLLFAAIVAAFFLPFVTVSCEGERVQATGIELATARVPGADEPDSAANSVEGEGKWFASVGLLCAVAGFGLSALRRERRRVPILVSLLGVLALGLGGLDASGSNDEHPWLGSPVYVELESGFWIAFMLFVALLLGNVLAALGSRRSRSTNDPSPKLPPGASPRL